MIRQRPILAALAAFLMMPDGPRLSPKAAASRKPSGKNRDKIKAARKQRPAKKGNRHG